MEMGGGRANYGTNRSISKLDQGPEARDQRSKLSDLVPPLLRRWWTHRTLAQQFVLAASIVLGLTMAILGSWLNARITAGVLQSTAEAGALYLETYLEPHIQALGSGQDLSAEDIAALDRISQNFASRRHILSIKIWKSDGTIAYSNLHSLIGSQFPTDEIEPALNGIIKGYLEQLDEDENAFERTLRVPLYEVYAPLYRTGTADIIAVGEIYENAKQLDAELARATLDMWLVVGGSTFVMLGVLFLIVNRGSQTIVNQKLALQEQLVQQERLYAANNELRNNVDDAMREAARIDELSQRRIGAELHDGPAQLLAFILIRLDDVKSMLASSAKSGVVKQKLAVVEELRKAAEEAMAEIRHISKGLFLRYLDDIGSLDEAMQVIIGEHERRTGTRVTLMTGDIPTRVPMDVLKCVARIVQEALANAYKHGGGNDQRVKVAREGDELRVAISDSGPGFPKDWHDNAGRQQRLGLVGMKHRAASIGGDLSVESPPEGGARIVCRVPLRTEDFATTEAPT